MMPLITPAVSWGYTEESDPARWGEINKAYATCQTGINQSLMDIQTTTTSKLGLPALSIQCAGGPTRFRSISHTLWATMSSYASNSIEINETLYCLKQFDLHASSEHIPNGKTYSLELQLVHKNQSGDITIVAVTFDIGEPSQAAQNLWEFFLIMEDSNVAIFSSVDIRQLLPNNKTYWRYRGSLTTPPYTEGVTWTILKMPASLSAEQMDKFHYTVGSVNNRPLQPSSERKTTDSYSGDAEILYQNEVAIA